MTGRRGFLAGTVSALWRLLGRIAALLAGRGGAAGDGQGEDLPPAHWLAAIRAAAPDKLDGIRLIADFEGRAPDPSAGECRAETGTGFVPPSFPARPVGVERMLAESRAATEALRPVSPRILAAPLVIVAPKTIAPEIVEPVIAGPGPVVPSPVGRRGGLRPRVAVLSPVSRAAEAAGSQSVEQSPEQSPEQRPERNCGSGISWPRRIPAVRVLSGSGLAAARSGAAEREPAPAGPGEAPGEGGAQGRDVPHRPISGAEQSEGQQDERGDSHGGGPKDDDQEDGQTRLRPGLSVRPVPSVSLPDAAALHPAPATLPSVPEGEVAFAGAVAASVRPPDVDLVPASGTVLPGGWPRRGSAPNPAPTGAGLSLGSDAAGRFPTMDPVREAEPLPSFERRLDGPEARRARFAREQGGELWTV
ncbi:hypothetical protein M2324_003150 [Rhodovulum sulfidophilum]|uniref:hypothetical protein n=1 Tax=Rhodovulum sulfidophilum TaxID=35806 RepID=UPI000697DCC7|nr:hypothetical protein [Rhodovulum sulfidophilum]ANB36342.1 hypothetical protein A6W98_19470 [Rhodovulum sulfidophilum DSM 1374]ANB40144.1 hypothetical protein A6024_19230 [Rhodovulum sulfidophilum]MCW2304736.1 hypothetical protein [Rhodovulum sulfidophilum]